MSGSFHCPTAAPTLDVLDARVATCTFPVWDTVRSQQQSTYGFAIFVSACPDPGVALAEAQPGVSPSSLGPLAGPVSAPLLLWHRAVSVSTGCAIAIVSFCRGCWTFLAVQHRLPFWVSHLHVFQCPQWELRTQKLKSHLVRTQNINVLPLKPGVGQYIAMHAMLTAGDFFLSYLCASGPFTCIYSKTSPDFFLCWLWLTPIPV